MPAHPGFSDLFRLCILLRSFLSLLIERPLHGGAYRLIGAVRASQPATGAALTLQQLFAGSPHTSLPGFNLFGILHPAHIFIPREWSDVFPEGERLCIGQKRLAEIRWQPMGCAARNWFRSHGYIIAKHSTACLVSCLNKSNHPN